MVNDLAIGRLLRETLRCKSLAYHLNEQCSPDRHYLDEQQQCSPDRRSRPAGSRSSPARPNTRNTRLPSPPCQSTHRSGFILARRRQHLQIYSAVIHRTMLTALFHRKCATNMEISISGHLSYFPR